MPAMIALAWSLPSKPLIAGIHWSRSGPFHCSHPGPSGTIGVSLTLSRLLSSREYSSLPMSTWASWSDVGRSAIVSRCLDALRFYRMIRTELEDAVLVCRLIAMVHTAIRCLADKLTAVLVLAQIALCHTRLLSSASHQPSMPSTWP